jgi:hypothetical protein
MPWPEVANKSWVWLSLFSIWLYQAFSVRLGIEGALLGLHICIVRRLYQIWRARFGNHANHGHGRLLLLSWTLLVQTPQHGVMLSGYDRATIEVLRGVFWLYFHNELLILLVLSVLNCLLFDWGVQLGIVLQRDGVRVIGRVLHEWCVKASILSNHHAIGAQGLRQALPWGVNNQHLWLKGPENLLLLLTREHLSI